MARGGEIAPEICRGTPMVPIRLDVMRHAQSRRSPICLILAAKTQKHLRQYRTHQRHAVEIKQVINGGLLSRARLPEKRSPDTRVHQYPIIHRGSPVTAENQTHPVRVPPTLASYLQSRLFQIFLSAHAAG